MTERILLKPLVGDGKVTIPKRFRDELDLDIGDEVYMSIKPASEALTADLHTDDTAEGMFKEDDEYELQAFGSGEQDSEMKESSSSELEASKSTDENSAYRY